MAQSLVLPVSLTAHVLDLLRERVLTGVLAPGARVNEVELATEIGISRGPVREAIRCLVSEGLLVGVPQHSARVLMPDRPYVTALFELRIGLETAAARLAAQRWRQVDLDRLAEVCARSREHFGSGAALPHQLDLEFHRVLLEVAASPLIADQVRRAQQQVIVSRNRLGALGAEIDDQHETSFAEHEAIVEALSSHDNDRVAQLMGDHLAGVRDRLLAQLVDTESDRASGVFNATLSAGLPSTRSAQ